MVDEVHDAGLLMYCWTVDDSEKSENSAGLGS
jgi:hypothetical protein